MTEEEYQKLINRRQGVTHKERTALQEAIEAANSKAKSPPEDQEQLALVNWLRMKGIRFHHSPNGGHRHKAVAGKLKAQGVSAGFPDLIIFPQIGSGRPLLFIELKRRKGGTISGSQKEWIDYLSELFCQGYPMDAEVCRGFDDARKYVESKGY